MPPLDSHRLVIVANRLPVTVVRDGGVLRVRRSVGGLATGLAGPHERSEGLWVGWPGHVAGVDVAADPAVRRQLEELRAVPIALSAGEAKEFYAEVSNGVLWPVCHDRLDRLPLHITGWNTYEAVNARFADAAAACWRPGDLVWVHDYQLLRVPALLRQRLPEARIGFFLHIPFPNPEIFFSLPTRRRLVEGMLGADLIGFHTRRFRGHFAASLRRLFGLELDGGGAVAWDGRRVRIGVFPMGVDAAALAEQAASREVSARVLEIRLPQRMLLGVDRLDYSKGIPRRLMALEQLLTRHPEWRGHVRLIQVAVPSRDEVPAYQRFRRELEALVTRVNGLFATPSWTPVQYIHRALPQEMLLALYRAADVMLVTPVRDGMNLVAKEFVASRTDEEGVLVLSEFAGSADELTDALIVNPYDIDAIADAIHDALTMSGSERRHRMRRMRSHVLTHDVHAWVDTFLSALAD